MVDTRAPGRTAPPQSDHEGDDLVALIDQMIVQRLDAVAFKIGTITNVRGDDAQVSVQRWDEDTGGEQFRARLAGTAFSNGDLVVMAPTGGGEYVVMGKIANSNADKAVVGQQELRDNAIASRHIAPGAIPLNRLASEVATPAQITQATQGLATNASVTTHVNNLNAGIANLQQQVNALKNAPNGITMADVNARLNANVYFDHKHYATRIAQNNGYEVMSALTYLKAFVTCTYNSRNKTGDPCATQKRNMSKIG